MPAIAEFPILLAFKNVGHVIDSQHGSRFHPTGGEVCEGNLIENIQHRLICINERRIGAMHLDRATTRSRVEEAFRQDVLLGEAPRWRGIHFSDDPS